MSIIDNEMIVLIKCILNINYVCIMYKLLKMRLYNQIRTCLRIFQRAKYTAYILKKKI